MNIRVGSVVGDYEVLELLGAGGVGAVFKVRHKIMGRTEAIKVLLPGSAYDPAQTQRFLREVEVQASLAHPNIASVLHAFQADESLVMVMEFVEGEALDKKLARERLSLSQALDYSSQALTALGYAHSRGVVHRDVKPSNMLVTPRGLLKMSDFGLAKRAEDPRLTATQSALGSLFYMSPEQVNGLARLDERTDIYSMGAVLYELTTGKRPFEQDQAFQLMLAHVESSPRAPHEVDPQIPRQLSDAILKALEKAPENRYQSARDFRQVIATVRVALSRPQNMPIHADPGYGDRAKSVEPVPSRVPHGNRTVVRQRASRFGTIPDLYTVGARLIAGARAKATSWGSTWAASAGIMLVLGLWAAYSLAYRAPRPERAPEPDLSRGSITLQPPASLAVASGRHEPVRRIVSGSVAQALTLNADGSRAAVSSRAGVIEVWDAYSGDLVGSRSNGGDAKALTFSPDGKLLAFASSDGRLRLWEVDASTEPVEFDSRGGAQAITFSDDNHLLAVAYPDSLGIWDVADSSRPRQAQQYQLSALALAFSPDRPILAAASSANSVELLPLDSSARSRAINVDGGVTALSFSSDGLWLAATGRKGVKVWQQDRADPLLSGFPEEFLAIAVTPLGRCIALTLGKEVAELWDITVDKQLSAFRHSQDLTAAALSRNGQVAATATLAGDLWIWKAPFGWDRPGASETLLTRVTDKAKKMAVKVGAKAARSRQPIQISAGSKSRSVRVPVGIDSIGRPESAQPNLPAVTAGIEKDPAAPPPKEPDAGTDAISETAQSATEREEPSDQAAGEENPDRKKKNIFRKVIGLFR